MFNIMDKVFRFFSIQGTTLTMYSFLEGEFKPFRMMTCLSLQMVGTPDEENPEFFCQSIWQWTDDLETPFEFRVDEMHYFVYKIVPLFNPQNKADYGIQTQEEPQRPQNF